MDEMKRHLAFSSLSLLLLCVSHSLTRLALSSHYHWTSRKRFFNRPDCLWDAPKCLSINYSLSFVLFRFSSLLISHPLLSLLLTPLASRHSFYRSLVLCNTWQFSHSKSIRGKVITQPLQRLITDPSLTGERKSGHRGSGQNQIIMFSHHLFTNWFTN